MKTTDTERSIMEHATAWPKCFRNHFVTGPDTSDWPVCQALVSRGLMSVSRPVSWMDGMSVFRVTEEGRAVLEATP